MPDPRYRAPRGASDILPADQPYWRLVREAAARVAESYGYAQIDTPVFEHAAVYIRPGAEGTDVVDKEMYVFEDRGGDELALRPEGTAGVVRAYIEHGMGSLPQPVRLFYIVPNFRYDRPQAGRYRVFHQFGVEAIGDASPAIDAEVIDLLRTFYDELGLGDYTLQLNSIGDAVCRPAYIEKLRAYYADKLDRICGDCRRRYDVNPLRMLDCKNEPCQPFKAGAPKIADNLCEPCANHFAEVRALLDGLGIAYEIAPTLVRGLDYYTRTTFEFEPAVEGSQSTIGAGGRYDGLMEALGGPPTPAIGFGTGIERIILNLKRLDVDPGPPASPDAYIAIPPSRSDGDASSDARPEALVGRASAASNEDGPSAVTRALTLARELRGAGLRIVTGAPERSLRAQLRHANQLSARYVLILGAEELASNTVTLRNLESSEQVRVPLMDLAERLRS